MSGITRQMQAFVKLMRTYQEEHNIKDRCFINSLVAAVWARKMKEYPRASVKAVIGLETKPYMENGEEKQTGVLVVHIVTQLDQDDVEEGIVEASQQYAKSDIEYFDNWINLEKCTKINKKGTKFVVTPDEMLEGRDRAKVTLPLSTKALLTKFIEYKERAKNMNKILNTLPIEAVLPCYHVELKDREHMDYLTRMQAFLVCCFREANVKGKDFDFRQAAREM
jgi:hypothetical protein